MRESISVSPAADSTSVNKMICSDLVSIETHFNPYRVNLQRVDRIPDIYVKVLVSTAGFHRLMSHGPEPTPASALIQNDVDVFQLRIDALRGVNEQLSLPEQQTSDATLLCVLALMIASVWPLPVSSACVETYSCRSNHLPTQNGDLTWKAPGGSFRCEED